MHSLFQYLMNVIELLNAIYGSISFADRKKGMQSKSRNEKLITKKSKIESKQLGGQCCGNASRDSLRFLPIRLGCHFRAFLT